MAGLLTEKIRASQQKKGLLDIWKGLLGSFDNNPRNAETMDAIFGLGGIIPGIGDAVSAAEAKYRWDQGDKLGAGLAGLGALPLVPSFAGMVAKKGGNAMDAVRPVNHLGQPIPPTQYELAHQTAQRNAALPVEQGGLGLPEGNTAMDRARAMGFDTRPSQTTYHGARGEIIGDIDPSMSDFGFHTGSLNQAEARLRAFGFGSVNFGDGANVLPLQKSKYANMLKVKDEGSFHADALAPQLERKGIIAKGKGKQIARDVDENWRLREQYDPMMRDAVEQAGYDGIKYSNAQEGDGMSYAFSNPTLLRSRFAAFDPMKRNSADLLAGLAPYAVPIGAGLFGSMFLLPPED